MAAVALPTMLVSPAQAACAVAVSPTVASQSCTTYAHGWAVTVAAGRVRISVSHLCGSFTFEVNGPSVVQGATCTGGSPTTLSLQRRDGLGTAVGAM